MIRKRKIKKQVWLNEEENKMLKDKASKVSITESELIRLLIKDCVIKEQPDERFYKAMREISSIGNNLNQIARRANSLNFVDADSFRREAKKLHEFMVKVKEMVLND